MPRAEAREPGLWQNGKLWWLRVRSPGAGPVPRSTGTADLRLANRIARMVAEMREERRHHEWLALAAAGALPLLELYTHYAAGTLHELRAAREVAAAGAQDPDLSPWVTRWDTEHLAARVRAGEIAAERRALCLRYVRAFIPEGPSFPRSRFTEDTVKAQLVALVHPVRGTPLTPAGQRKYVDALKLFYRYARKRVPLTVDPFDDADWIPANSAPRSIAWGFAEVQTVLPKVASDERRAALALTFGAGIELGALLALKGRDVGPGGDETGRWVIAHGTKNDARKGRKIFVRKWAWELFYAHAKTILPTARVFQSLNPKNRGRDLRDAFYEAQADAGLIERPKRAASGKRPWKRVHPHTIHDCRHTFINITALGLDGERRLTKQEQYYNLGHADGTMIDKVYGKLNIEQQLRLIELAEARQEGKRRDVR